MAFFKIHQIMPALPIDVLIERLDSLLLDPNLKIVPGIVEAQSAYGDAEASPKAQPRSKSTADDLTSAPAPAGKKPSADPDEDQPGGHGPGNDAWSEVIARIAETKPSIAAALTRSQLVSMSEQTFAVRVHDNDYSMNLIKKNLTMIDAICRELASRKIQVDFFSSDSEENPTVSAKQKADDIRQQLLNHPLLADAVEIFSGKIEEIKIK
jgi:DNA polymerase-3 subunit gamma/tau